MWEIKNKESTGKYVQRPPPPPLSWWYWLYGYIKWSSKLVLFNKSAQLLICSDWKLCYLCIIQYTVAAHLHKCIYLSIKFRFKTKTLLTRYVRLDLNRNGRCWMGIKSRNENRWYKKKTSWLSRFHSWFIQKMMKFIWNYGSIKWIYLSLNRWGINLIGVWTNAQATTKTNSFAFDISLNYLQMLAQSLRSLSIAYARHSKIHYYSILWISIFIFLARWESIGRKLIKIMCTHACVANDEKKNSAEVIKRQLINGPSTKTNQLIYPNGEWRERERRR